MCHFSFGLCILFASRLFARIQIRRSCSPSCPRSAMTRCKLTTRNRQMTNCDRRCRRMQAQARTERVPRWGSCPSPTRFSCRRRSQRTTPQPPVGCSAGVALKEHTALMHCKPAGASLWETARGRHTPTDSIRDGATEQGGLCSMCTGTARRCCDTARGNLRLTHHLSSRAGQLARTNPLTFRFATTVDDPDIHHGVASVDHEGSARRRILNAPADGDGD